MTRLEPCPDSKSKEIAKTNESEAAAGGNKRELTLGARAFQGTRARQ